MPRALGLAAAALVALSACATSSPSAAQPTVSVANDTTVPVAIAVNGIVVETVPAGTTEDPIHASLPPRPWSVVARSPGGRVLATLTVRATDDISASASVGAFGDLACGQLALGAGGPRGDHPIPSPASLVSCD